MGDEEDEEQGTIRRVRALLSLAAKKGHTGQEPPKERRQKETEFFKKLFVECDRNGTGTLNFSEVTQMIRKRLKIAERLVSERQLHQFFNSIDRDGGGDISFHEFLAFVRTQPRNHRLNELVLTQVKRAVRLAIQRRGMTLVQLEARFNRSAEEGIIDTAGGDGALGPEEMRRFFRKILEVSAHEAPDRNLMIAFKAMDEDGGGSLDAEEFMDFIREAVTEEMTLCPLSPRRPAEEPRQATLLCGMRGVLPKRLPTMRPGTTYEFGTATVPFCTNGREVDSKMRLSASSPAVVKSAPCSVPRQERPLGATLLPTGLPKSVATGRAQTASSFRSTSATNFFMTAAAMDATSRAEDALSPKSGMMSRKLAGTTSLPSLAATAPAGFGEIKGKESMEPSRSAAPAAARGHYTAVRGMLSAKDANALNRIEQRLFDAGVDVRGQYHNTEKGSSAPDRR